MKRWDDHPPTTGVCYPIRLDPQEIQFLCAVVEGHEGLGVVRTIDQHNGIVEFWFSPLMQDDVDAFLATFGQQIDLTIAPPRQIDTAALV